jgi:hypothetical protein
MWDFKFRSDEAYARLKIAELHDFAWEMLRRNGHYWNDFRLLQGRGSLVMSNKFRKRWGLSFRG